MKTFLKAVLITAILFTTVLALTVYWSLYRPLPSYSGTLILPGLHQPVTVNWDENGVPHIHATNQEDLYYAMGYVHARDRLWQITLHQLTIQGRFSEFLGEDFIDLDKFLRTIGLYHTAKKNRELYNSTELSILQSYADGINDFAANNSGKLPLEFSLASMEPIHFTIEDAIAIPRLMAWNLNLVWRSKVVVAHIAETKPPGVIRRILPEAMAEELIMNMETPESDDSGNEVSLGHLLPLLEIDSRLRELNNWSESMQGSNAWAVDGSKTESGQTILAGDPHLNLGSPSIWYEAHLNLNGSNVAGVSVPGNPLIFIGRNDHIAWTITSLMADVLDFYEEAQDPADRGRYISDSSDTVAVYSAFQIRREIIKVKDEDELLHEVRSTRNGPLVNDVHDLDVFNGRRISMSWAGNEPGNEMRAGMALNWGDSYQDVIDYAEQYTAPAINLLFADQAGNIGHLVLGKIPVRSGSALVFRKGWLPGDRWQGFIPETRMLRVVNPASGWLVNANNNIYQGASPYYISHFWDHPSRYERIREVIGSGDGFTASDMMALQNDIRSPFAENITGYILPVLQEASADSVIAGVLPYLSNWDFRYDINSTAASLLDGFVLEFSRNLAARELGDELYPHYMNMLHTPQLVVEQQLSRFSAYHADEDTNTVSDFDSSMVISAMKQAVNMLSEEFGNEPWQWRWLNPHTVTFSPPIFTQAAEQDDAGRTRRLIVRNILSRGPYPAPGHGLTVNNGTYRGSEPFRMHSGPSYRIVADFSRPGYYHSVLPPGQSGLALSRHFDDQIENWLNGTYKRVFFTGEAGDQTEFRTLNLKPERTE